MTPVAVISIGVYDGVHAGHRAVLGALVAAGRRASGTPVVFTFDRHPDVVLGKREAAPRLTTANERVEALREAGAKEVRVLRFDERLAARSPREFLVHHVFPFYRVAGLVVGYDFAMGKGREGTLPALARLGERLGFSVQGIPPTRDAEGPLSSSRIRDAVAAGEMDLAARLLGRPYSVRGPVAHGDGRGSGLGFPTANLEVSGEKLLPARGVYAVRVHGPGLDGADAVVNVGRRPTFGEGPMRVEAHLLGEVVNLRGADLSLDFVRRLRDERKFNDAKELSDQIARDVQTARAVLNTEIPADNSLG